MSKRNWVFGAIFVWSLTGAVVVATLATRDNAPVAATEVPLSQPGAVTPDAVPGKPGPATVPGSPGVASRAAPAAPHKSSKAAPLAMPWETSFEKAMERSKSEGKPVMVDFYTDWCSACKYLDASVYTDKSVLNETNNWIVVKVDAEKRADVAGAYNVHSYPTIAFLNSDGKPIAVQEGAPQEAATFIDWMRQAYSRFVPPAAV